ncbi:MAG: putative bacterial non-heme ferritin [Candidatus Omnitrophica bacterium]|nr:putative bacterial non-heme ferritin [Candidatus Omnitrophota bacterium]
MLTQKIQDALNDQIAEEAFASNAYLSMASWCDKNGYQGSAAFLYGHAEAERAHMLKLFHYVNDAGGHAALRTVKEPPRDFRSLSEVFEKTLENELHVTASINALVSVCLAEKDYSSFNFLQWYVAEQHEEEHLFRSILDLLRIAGTEGRGLFFVDKEIGKKVAPQKAGA